jgi:hypothetical protein
MAQRTGHRQRPLEERRAAVTEHLERVDARGQETIDGVSSTVERALEGVTPLQETVAGDQGMRSRRCSGVSTWP